MNSTNISISQMNDANAGDLSRLIGEVISPLVYYSEQARKSEIEKYSPASLREAVAKDKDSILIAFCGERIVGFCITHFDDGLIWLSWIGVHPEFRRYKTAEKLLLKMEESVPARGAHKIWCDCRTVNKASIALLGGLGYRQICTVDNHWYGQDFILWEKLVNQ